MPTKFTATLTQDIPECNLIKIEFIYGAASSINGGLEAFTIEDPQETTGLSKIFKPNKVDHFGVWHKCMETTNKTYCVAFPVAATYFEDYLKKCTVTYQYVLHPFWMAICHGWWHQNVSECFIKSMTHFLWFQTLWSSLNEKQGTIPIFIKMLKHQSRMGTDSIRYSSENQNFVSIEKFSEDKGELSLWNQG